ncbi:MAG TPA: ATP-binding protein, partial [Verrucomicrobiae bacterium]|nr:ATP-binding protein [Verrucomicrobiae bacterium]
NPAGRELAGFGPDEDISQVQMDAFLKDATSASLAEKLNHVRQQGFWRGESEIAQKHGGRIPASEQIMAHVQEGTSGCYWSIVARDISDRKRAEMELAKVHRELLKTSRMAGMAEVANGVLHNVKNALNSINIASTCLAESIRKSNSDKLSKIVELFRQHESNLALFLTTDAKGMQIPGYLAQLADRLQHEQQSLLEELARLQKGIEHIKSVVVAQQNTARTAGRAECVKISELVHESLELSSLMESGHGVQVVLDLNPEDYLTTDRQKVVQILLNLLGNAKQACEESQKMENTVTIRGRITENRLRIEVIDTGVGIAPEHLERIFSHGFTTKANGHGFGLHSSLLTAKELGGMLRVDSKGINQGAVFTLELPV